MMGWIMWSKFIASDSASEQDVLGEEGFSFCVLNAQVRVL
jgi:hypothetical protein